MEQFVTRLEQHVVDFGEIHSETSLLASPRLDKLTAQHLSQRVQRAMPDRLALRFTGGDSRKLARVGCAKAKGTADDGRVKLKLDLHDIYNRGADIDRALRAIIDEAIATKAPLVEIIPGKGSGALKKRVLRFLDQKEIKALYHRVEKDSDNFGRVFVHFRWK